VARPRGLLAPAHETSITWSAARSRILAVKIDRPAVEALGEARGKAFAPSVDLREGHGRSWAGLLRELIFSSTTRPASWHRAAYEEFPAETPRR
jgi:hypothetical protein